MSENKRYYWIKLKETFMTSDAVDFLMSQPDGANYVVLYQMLCLKTINTGGKLERHIGEVIIPYDEAKIQRDTKYFNIDTVRVALTLYKSLGLIYADNNGTLCLTDHENLVGSETNWKEIKQKQRAKKLPVLNDGKRLNSNTLLLPTGERQIVDEKRYGGNGMKAFDLAGYCCEMCGANTGLVIHHANEYSNDIDDLYILCTTCHGIVHSESTPSDWLHHTRGGQAGGQVGGQDGGHVHLNVHPDIDIRDRDKSIEKDKEIEKEDTPLKGGMGGNEKDEKKTSKKTDYGKEEFEKDLSVLSKPMADSVVEWLKYKKQRREAYKPVSIKKFITQVKGYAEQYGEEAVMTVISDSIANGYMGVAFASIKGKKPNGGSGSRTANYDYSDTEGAL